MKYLSDYNDEAMTKLFDETGTFFAFNEKHLNEHRQEGVEYVSLGGGMICPKDNAKALIEQLDNIIDAGMKADLAENGKKGVIHRELANHEYSYTYDITDTARALKGYGITEEEIQAEASAYLKEYHAWEDKQEAIA